MYVHVVNHRPTTLDASSDPQFCLFLFVTVSLCHSGSDATHVFFLVNMHIVSALTSVFFSLSSLSLSSLRRAGIGRGKRSVLKTKVWEPMETSVDGNAGTLEPHAQDVGCMLLWTRAKYHSFFYPRLVAARPTTSPRL